MRRLALFIMVLAWLFQGMMPALAVPMTPTMLHQHPQMDANAGHHAMAGVKTDQHCPACDAKPVKAACTMNLCAACTALPPLTAMDGGAAPVVRYPAPALVPALVAFHAAPLLPPPRA